MVVSQREQHRVDIAELLGNVGDGVLAIGAGGVVSYANAAASRILGTGRRDLVGSPLPLPGADGGRGDPVGEALRRVLHQRRPSTFLARLGHQPQWYEVRAMPTPDGLVAYLRNVEAEQRAEGRRLELVARLHRSDEHAQRLLELTRALAGALTPTDVAETVTAHLRRALNPALAGVRLLEPSGGSLRLVGASPLPSASSPDWARLSLAGAQPATLAVRRRRASFQETPDAAAHLPLRAGDGTVLGALSVTWRGPHPLSVSERGFLGIVAGQAAQAIERALLAEQRESPAEVLHRAALPTSLPLLPGWQLAGRYLPAAVGVAGGEWYDAFTVPGGRICLLVGDTSGHGLGTARTATLLRDGARAYALLGEGPGGTLARLDRLLSSSDPDAIATLTCLELDAGTGAGVWASAGHPPPVLSRPGGWQLPGPDDGDPPLGCLPAGPPREHPVVLGPGESALLVTRGLLRGPDGDRPDVTLSMLGLHAAGQRPGDGPDGLEDLLDGVLRGVLDGTHPQAAVCMLAAARTRPVLDLPALEGAGADAADPSAPPDRHVRRTLRPLPQAAAEARRLTRQTLAGWGLDALSDPATLVVSELVTNAVTHARSALTLDLTTDGGTVRVSVTDACPATPYRREVGGADEQGRGVHLVEVLSTRWGTELLPTGKRVWAELDAGTRNDARDDVAR